MQYEILCLKTEFAIEFHKLLLKVEPVQSVMLNTMQSKIHTAQRICAVENNFAALSNNFLISCFSIR